MDQGGRPGEALQRALLVLQRWAEEERQPVHTKRGKTSILLVRTQQKHCRQSHTIDGQAGRIISRAGVGNF